MAIFCATNNENFLKIKTFPSIYQYQQNVPSMAWHEPMSPALNAKFCLHLYTDHAHCESRPMYWNVWHNRCTANYSTGVDWHTSVVYIYIYIPVMNVGVTVVQHMLVSWSRVFLPWTRHDMETHSTLVLLAVFVGNPRVIGGFHSQKTRDMEL